MLRTTKNIVLSATLAVFIVPSTALANWYWISVPDDPETGYFLEDVSDVPNTIGYINETDDGPQSSETRTVVPENFMETMDLASASSRCSQEHNLTKALEELRDFDSSNEFRYPSTRTESKGSHTWEVDIMAVNEETIDRRENLLDNIASRAQNCLDEEKEEIEQAIEEQERKEAEEARMAAIEEAVANCDLDFFDTMTTKEKMDTYDEREACKAESVVEGEEEAVDLEPVEEAVETLSHTPPIEAPVVPAAPVIHTNPEPTPTPATPEPTLQPEINTESSIDTNEASNTPEEIEAVNEPDVPQESITEQVEPEPEQEQRPSFFQRVIRFFTSWF